MKSEEASNAAAADDDIIIPDLMRQFPVAVETIIMMKPTVDIYLDEDDPRIAIAIRTFFCIICNILKIWSRASKIYVHPGVVGAGALG